MQVSYSFWDAVQQYFAKSIFLPLFLLAFIWIIKKWIKEKKYVIAAVGCACICVFNGITYRLFDRVGEGSTYYRLFWMIPVILFVAVFLTDCVRNLEKGKKLLVLALICLASFMFTPKTGAEWFELPENIYQLDSDIIQVADALMEVTQGESTYLYALDDIGDDIRQYNAKVMSTGIESFDLELVLRGTYNNMLSRDIQNFILDNHSRYFAVHKQDVQVCKLLENAGLKQVNETDNYYLYYVNYDQLEADWTECVLNESGPWGFTNIEYIPISGFEEELEYVYLTDFGDTLNTNVYEEVLNKIADIQPDGIIINSRLSKQEEWAAQYAEYLTELGIPYYCNDKEFQVISTENIEICMIDNKNQVSESTLIALKEIISQEKPVILVLSKQLAADTGSDLLGIITEENSSIVQVLSAEKETYTKTLLGKQILQYAVPADSGQMLNILRIEALEPEEIIAY